MQAPLVNWTPSIAPSSMVYYRGAQFTHWQDHLLIPTLKTRQVHVIDTKNGYTQSIIQLDEAQRLRDIAIDTSGNILLLTDGENGQVIQLSALPSS
jgi:glucose/arabinose dehydrogenase